ncbi:hypothetical protein AAC387_Pa08g0397 [Persea americana]
MCLTMAKMISSKGGLGVIGWRAKINKTNRGEISPDELKERQAKAMQDPEIQNILSDPVLGQVLMDFQETPRAAQDHLKNLQTQVQLPILRRPRRERRRPRWFLQD